MADGDRSGLNITVVDLAYVVSVLTVDVSLGLVGVVVDLSVLRGPFYMMGD